MKCFQQYTDTGPYNYIESIEHLLPGYSWKSYNHAFQNIKVDSADSADTEYIGHMLKGALYLLFTI